MFRQAITCLFDDETLDARALIKWKEVYERIENESAGGDDDDGATTAAVESALERLSHRS